MVQITAEQLESARDGIPTRVVDDQTDTKFVLIREDFYDRIKSVITDERMSEDEQRVQLAEMGRRAGWDDPAMDIYDELDPRRKP